MERGLFCSFKDTHGKYCCSHKKKYGFYCYKHRANYLCDEKGILIESRFTGEMKDYTIQMLKDYCKIHNISLKEKPAIGKVNKSYLFNTLKHRIQRNKIYIDNLPLILKIQKTAKMYLRNKIRMLRGPGFVDKQLCRNSEDFYYMTTLEDIDDDYFFSYKDESNNVWFFDVRSIHKLIHMNQDNPYTREPIHDSVKENVHALIKYLLKNNKNVEIEETIQRTKKQQIKQKCVDIFGDIQQMGWDCHIDWFLSLSLVNLKKLYRGLEDIWNYRSQITPYMKAQIAPPNGQIFSVPIHDIYQYTVREDIQNIILNDVQRFMSAQESDKKTGYMYFIIGLSEISLSCKLAHPWTHYV
jgi:hypothetical protein